MSQATIAYDDLRPETIELLRDGGMSVLSHPFVYVNSTTGDDLNDGLTPETAIRSLSRLSTMLTNTYFRKTDAYRTGLTVLIYSGIYDGTLSIEDLPYTVYVQADKPLEGGPVVFTSANSVKVCGASSISFDSISFLADEGEGEGQVSSIMEFIDSTVRLANCEFRGGGKDGASSQYSCINAQLSKLFLVNTRFLGGTLVPHHHTGSDIRISNVHYDSSYSEIPLQLDTYSGEVAIGSTKMRTVDALGTGLDFGVVNLGIAIESAENGNGAYIKYANGLLICYNAKIQNTMDITSGTGGFFRTTTPSKWVYPHAFKTSPPYVSIVTKADGFPSWVIAPGGVSNLVSHEYNVASSIGGNRPVTVVGLAIGRWK